VIELRDEQLVAEIVSDNRWTVRVERGHKYILCIGVDPDGAARGYIRLHVRDAATLAQAILEAADR
jgi:hypothetical protein